VRRKIHLISRKETRHARATADLFPAPHSPLCPCPFSSLPCTPPRRSCTGFLTPSYYLTDFTASVDPANAGNSLHTAAPLIVQNFAIGVGRICAGSISDFVGPCNAMFFSFAAGGILQLGMWSQIDSYGSTVAFGVLYGLFGSWFFLLMPAVAANVSPPVPLLFRGASTDLSPSSFLPPCPTPPAPLTHTTCVLLPSSLACAASRPSQAGSSRLKRLGSSPAPVCPASSSLRQAGTAASRTMLERACLAARPSSSQVRSFSPQPTLPLEPTLLRLVRVCLFRLLCDSRSQHASFVSQWCLRGID